MALMRTYANILRNRKAKRQPYRFTITSRNGQIIAIGEHYTRKAGAIRGARRAFPHAVLRDRTGEKVKAA